MKQPYIRHYRPPIPGLTIRLYSSVSDAFTDPLLALVDTGSDASLVPLNYLRELGAEETAPGWLISITGERKPVALFFVDVYVGDRAFSGIRVIGEADADEVVLGREVLNRLPLFLDGPETNLLIPNEKSVSRLRQT